ncbi:MAG: HDOD domain-containing protein, partial [Methylococcaceae bacterium]|nr:HDOD domain-containing protein [Methylococcaceae bacterium]
MKASDSAPIVRRSLEEWTESLRVEEMPIFSNTAQRIYAALDDKQKGAMELATIILQDPNLTAKLLKLSNSPYYNPSRQKISTITRAIVILGIHLIRELTLACSFFESILSSTNKEKANIEIAKAIHSAVQARELAIILRDQSPEEVFVAALLHNIGRVAFWCSNNKYTAKLHAQIASSKLEATAAEKEVLGFSLDELGKKLSKAWCLTGLINDAINHPDAADKRIQLVRMGQQICHAVNQGWDSKAMQNCLSSLNKMSNEDIDVIQTRIKANILRAVDIAAQFGAHDASKFISREPSTPAVAIEENVRPDKKFIQFQILQDITTHMSGKFDLNALFEMVLEGIHRGVEMDRTLFLLLGPDKKSLTETISLGWQKTDISKKIHIYNNDPSGNLLFHSLNEHDGLWFNPKQAIGLYTTQIEVTLGKQECFVFPVYAEEKPMGLIYCDRGVHHKGLTKEDFYAAKNFVNQAQIGLIIYRMQKSMG